MKNPARALFFILLLASCKKNDGAASGANHSGDPLVSETTGWKRVASIPYGGKHVDARAVPHSMTAYDIVVNGSALQVLYSEDRVENGDQFSFYFKASSPVAGGTDPAVTEISDFPRLAVHADEESYQPFFRPGTYSVETFQFVHNAGSPGYALNLYNEAAQQITSKTALTPIASTARMRPNGDILMGGLQSAAAIEMLYYNRAANSWTLNLQSNADTESNIAYAPFMVEGEPAPLAFRLYSKHTKAYLSIAGFLPNTQYPDPPYSTRFREEHPEYAPSSLNGLTPVYPGTASLAAYTVEGASLTAVIAYKNKASGAYTLSAYKWTRGGTSFQQLYSGVAVSAALGEKLSGSSAGQCTAAGTVYVLMDAENPAGGSRMYHLSLTDAGGEKSYGAVYSSSTRYSAVLSTLRCINGAYFAAVTPQFAGTNYEGQHMDVVKLTP